MKHRYPDHAERKELRDLPDYGACVTKTEVIEYCRVRNIKAVAERWNLTWKIADRDHTDVHFNRIGMKHLNIRDYILYIPNYGAFPLPASTFDDQYVRVEPVDRSQEILVREVNRLSTYYRPTEKKYIDPPEVRKEKQRLARRKGPKPPTVYEIGKVDYHE